MDDLSAAEATVLFAARVQAAFEGASDFMTENGVASIAVEAAPPTIHIFVTMREGWGMRVSFSASLVREAVRQGLGRALQAARGLSDGCGSTCGHGIEVQARKPTGGASGRTFADSLQRKDGVRA